MAKLKELETRVLEVLKNNDQSRGDDFILVLEVYKSITSENDFETLMRNHKELKLPSIASITRCRRKIFENYPELKPLFTTAERKELEETYKEYSRG